MPAAVTQFRWDYVMESGIRGTALALALWLPGDYPPLGAGGITGCKSVAGLSGHSLAHRFPFNLCAGAVVSLWRTCSDTVSQRRVAMKVAGLAVWAEALPETKLTDEQVPLSHRPPHS